MQYVLYLALFLPQAPLRFLVWLVLLLGDAENKVLVTFTDENKYFTALAYR